MKIIIEELNLETLVALERERESISLFNMDLPTQIHTNILLINRNKINKGIKLFSNMLFLAYTKSMLKNKILLSSFLFV